MKISTGLAKIDTVLGGGLVLGKTLVLTGVPGVGKTTLLLQIAGNMASKCKVMYATTEQTRRDMLALETRLQIRRRNLFIVADGEVEMILSEAEAIKPKFLIVDSLQGLFRSRRADILANRLVEFAENNRIALVLVSHLGKSTHCIPLRLEHLVAGVLELEHFGDPLRHFLRATKMRTARLVSTELKMNETGFAFARKGRA